jgi:uncharacterized surface protein with fasciclin (FAS1) repeats
MKRIIQFFLCVLCVFPLIQCNEEVENYYERPDWLEKPIYEVLAQDGNFSQYLQCVDKTEYAQVLKGAGLYTVFAPNDEAFSAYLKEKTCSSVNDLPEEELKNLVAYSIVYSQWSSEHLGDYLSEELYVPGAFKRKTNCYVLPYPDSEFEGNWVFNQTITNGGYSYYSSNYQIRPAMNNYKYLPVFSSAYFNSFPEALNATDYNTFYPDVAFTGKNVQAGTIVRENITAENGIIHEVSTVSEPIKNMDEILRDPGCSGFKSLLDFKDINGKTVFKHYTEVSATNLEMFQKMCPNENINKVYVKTYNSLAFSPLLENIYSEAIGGYASEQTGNTLFVPQNDVLHEFIQNKLLKYYGSTDQLPQEVVSTLINTHMATGLVWPALYKTGMTSTGEYVNGEGAAGKAFEEDGITDKKMAGNGFVYQTDHVIKSKYFETVYSEIFLNPEHTWLNRAYVNYYNSGLREDLMKSVLSGYPSERYTLLNFSDELLKADGFTYSSVSNSFSNSEMPESASADDRFKRLIRMHIFPGLKNNEVDSEISDFTTSPVSNYEGWGFLVNAYGDLVRYKNNQLQAAGNIEDGTYVTLAQLEEPFNNGLIYNVDQLLQYSPRTSTAADDRWKELTLWQYLARAKREHPTVSLFVDYVETCLKNADTDDLDGIKAENFYTVLMVNNSAMNQAISRGYIDPLTTITGGDLDARAKATQFLNAHFLQGTVLPDDGLNFIYPVNSMSPNRTLMPTLLKITDEALGLTNAATRIEVTKTATGLLNFMPQPVTLGTQILVNGGFGLTATMRVQRGKVTGTSIPNNYRSNRIACKAVLHEVNNFFTFTLNHD